MLNDLKKKKNAMIVLSYHVPYTVFDETRNERCGKNVRASDQTTTVLLARASGGERRNGKSGTTTTDPWYRRSLRHDINVLINISSCAYTRGIICVHGRAGPTNSNYYRRRLLLARGHKLFNWRRPPRDTCLIHDNNSNTIVSAPASSSESRILVRIVFYIVRRVVHVA